MILQCWKCKISKISPNIFLFKIKINTEDSKTQHLRSVIPALNTSHVSWVWKMSRKMSNSFVQKHETHSRRFEMSRSEVRIVRLQSSIWHWRYIQRFIRGAGRTKNWKGARTCLSFRSISQEELHENRTWVLFLKWSKITSKDCTRGP